MTLILFAKFLHQKTLDFVTEKYKRSSNFNQNLQFQMLQKRNSNIPKKPTGRPKKLTEKDEKKLVTDVLKNPMVSLEKVRVHFNSFSTKESITRQTVRKISRKHRIRSRIAAQKLNLKREHKINRQKWCKLIKNRPFSYWQNVVFTDETRVRLTSDGIVRVLRKNGTRYNVDTGEAVLRNT